MHRYKCLYSTVTSVVCYSLDLDYSMIYNTILEVLIGLELERGGGVSLASVRERSGSSHITIFEGFTFKYLLCILFALVITKLYIYEGQVSTKL